MNPRTWSAAHVGLALSAALTAALLVRGPHASLTPNLLLLTVAFAGMAVLLVAERRHPRLTRRGVVSVSGLLFLLAVVVPPTQSHDVWSYAMYGRMVAHYRVSPYTHTPANFRADRLYRRVDPVWRHTASVYGPGFAAVMGAGTKLAGDSPLRARLFFQSLAALAVALAMAIVHRQTGGSVGALAVLGVNPFIVINVVNDGHCDALVGLAVLAAVVLAVRNRRVACGLVLALAILVKVTAVLPLLAVALWLMRHRGARVAATMTGVAVALVLAGYLLAGGRVALQPVEDARAHITHASVWRLPRAVLVRQEMREGVRGRLAGTRVGHELSAWAGALVVGLSVLLVGRRVGHASPALAAGSAVVSYTLVGAYVLPFYLAWAVLPLALCWRSRLALLAMGQAALLQLAYVPNPRVAGRIHRPLAFHGMARLQLVFRQVGVPLVEVAVLVAVVALSVRSLPVRKPRVSHQYG